MLGYYGPALLAMLRAIRHMPPALRKHRSVGPQYATLDKAIGGTVDVQDPALNLYLRAALEFKYRSVVEIGAYNGARILNFKRLVPSAEAWGVDILPNYQTPFERDGVRFRRFESAFFEQLATPALVCARGTLCYFQRSDLADFFRVLARRGIDIALYEPVAYRNVPNSLQRSPTSFYHPYDHLLRETGLTPLADFNAATGFSFNLSMMEAWYVMLARAKTVG
jgi:hypothetical protein